MANPILASIDANLGSISLGTFAAAVLYGITSLQTFNYFKYKNRDRSQFKSLIFVLWIVDSIHIAFIVHIQYYFLVTNYAKPEKLLVPLWSFGVSPSWCTKLFLRRLTYGTDDYIYGLPKQSMPVVTTISDSLVRAVFAHRIWLVSKKQLRYPVIVMLFTLTSMGGSLACAVKLYRMDSLSQLHLFADSFFIGMGSGAIADFVIACSMVYLLVKSHTGFKHTDVLVNTLMIYAINTGLFTTVCRLIELIIFAVWMDKFAFFGIYYVLPELSLNALLATLNARESLRERTFGVTSIPLELTIGGTQASSVPQTGHANNQSLTIHIDKVVTASDR